MWPWEHAALGYLVYSLGLRALGREPPSDGGAFALFFGTQLPDLIDKSLSWGLGVFPTGYALGHSVFVALPVGVALSVVAIRTERVRLGAAFTVGYWSHLAGDVLNPLRYGEPPNVTRILWPVVSGPPYEQNLGAGRGLVYLGEFLGSLQSIPPGTLLVTYLLLPLVTVLVWITDGYPGLAVFVRVAKSE